MRFRLLTLALILLVGCTLSANDEARFSPTPLPAPELWETYAPGLERRTYTPNSFLSQIIAVRIDPAFYTFRVHYRPGEPFTLQDWVETLSGVEVLVNANFFDINHQILGLLVSDGVVYGQSLRNSGGTFAIQDTLPRIWSNTIEPYTGQLLEQAVQAQPMLVLDNEPVAIRGQDRISRRTAVAQDTQGRIILLVTPLLGLTLRDLSDFLAASDMEIVRAFNLDGGRSTMMYVEASSYELFSVDAVPSVLAVYSRLQSG